MTFRSALAALALSTGTLLPFATAPVAAAVDASNPQRFIETLILDGFAAAHSGSKAVARNKFRDLLLTHVAVDMAGDRLIRRWLPTITPAQKAQYKAVLPNYIVGTYADNLIDYSDAAVKVVRVTNTPGGADVQTTVTRPGRQPIPAIWSVVQVGGAWKVVNIRVAGINVAMAQSADFDSVIQRQGFDALLKMMKSRG